MSGEDNKLKIFGELSDVFPSMIPLNGKRPIEDDWTYYCENTRLYNPTDFNGHNAGLTCGPANGIIAIDVDNLAKFEAACKAKNWELPATRRHQTGTGKPHIFYEYPKNGKRYGNKALNKKWGFDIRGIGGQVVAPGSIHPDTGKPYKVLFDLPIEKAPQWLLDLALQEDTKPIPQQGVDPTEFDSLPLSFSIKNLIKNGTEKGERSEAQASVLSALIRAKVSDQAIFQIFDIYPIGDKYREKGQSKSKWLQDEIERARKFSGEKIPHETTDIAAQVREYLLDEFDGGTFRIGDLKRELGLNDKKYTLARQTVRRMVKQGVVQKHGQQMGSYRVVDKTKNAITWDAITAKVSKLILPCGLNKMVTIRDGDMICFAAFKNHSKSALAIESVRANLDNFKIHFFITEYPARMKRRLLDFGIDLSHPNLKCYPIEKADYIPDKIEPGEGVLNIIDHWPNLDNFYLIGKYQDEIHRVLDGAICIITHQKLKEQDLEAVGGTFWRTTPTLAVTVFPHGKPGENKYTMQIVKGKEPAPETFGAENKKLEYQLIKGCQFGYDPNGWKY